MLPSEFTQKVTRQSQETFTLAKQDVEKDWGEIGIEVIEEDYNKDKHDKRANEATNWFKLYGGRLEVNPMEEEKPQEQ